VSFLALVLLIAQLSVMFLAVVLLIAQLGNVVADTLTNTFWPLGNKSIFTCIFFKDDILACVET